MKSAYKTEICILLEKHRELNIDQFQNLFEKVITESLPSITVNYKTTTS